MSKHCGDCGNELSCEKNGALLFSGDLKMVCRTDAYICKKCDHMILTGHGGWAEASIEQINLKPRYNRSLQYEHYSAREDRPVCVECGKVMNFMGDGILLLDDEHAYNKGKMWSCPHCDYVFIDRPHAPWPPPLSLDEKRELEEQYAPNIVRIGTGVIPFFKTIKEAEEKEAEIMDEVLESA